VLEIAMQTALSRRGVAVVALPGDVALRDAVEQGHVCVFRNRSQEYLRPMMNHSDGKTC